MRFFCGLMIVAIAAVIFGPSLLVHIEASLDAKSFNRDACQHIAPYLRYHDSPAFDNDIITDYFLACHPIGYRALLTALSHWTDPRMCSVVLAYVLFAILLVFAALTADRLGGCLMAALVVLLLFSAPIFLSTISGGFPRACRYPLLAVLGFALVSGNVRGLILGTILAVLFDPPSAVLGGLAMAFVLFLMPASFRGSAGSWTWQRRLTVLAATGIATGVLMAPSFMAVRVFGPVIKPADWKEYPEAGPGGRSQTTVHIGAWRDLAANVESVLRRGMVNRRGLFFPAANRAVKRYTDKSWVFWTALSLSSALAVAQCRGSPAVCRLLTLIPSALLAYALSRLLYPHFFQPDRYVTYTTAFLGLFVLLLGVKSLADVLMLSCGKRIPEPAVTRLGALVQAVCGICVLLVLGGGVACKKKQLSGEGMRLVEFARKLPPQAMLAGWPSLMNAIPLKASRRVLASAETQLAYHRGYTDEMRRRMNAYIAASFATNAAPLIVLRETFEVSHLVVNTNDYFGKLPRYHPPYRQWWADAKHNRGALDSLEVFRQRPVAEVFSHGPLFVLDLNKIREGE